MEDKIKITVGTSNMHKISEMNNIASGLGIEFVPVEGDFNPDENGSTFEENAKIKAVEASKCGCGEYFMADDSGLCVEFLNGAPGIHSARYEETAEKRIEKLLNALKGAENRNAKFVCALCLVNKKGEIIHTSSGEVNGIITEEKRGQGGFGYDPVFYIQDLGKTMAELSMDEKNTLSHRGRALFSMLEWLKINFSAGRKNG